MSFFSIFFIALLQLTHTKDSGSSCVGKQRAHPLWDFM